AAGVTLTADSGVRATYAKDELLFVVTRPIPVPQTSTSTWRLVDPEGFEGVAVLADADLRLEPATATDAVIAEVPPIKAIVETPVGTTLRFTAPIRYWYDRATTTLSGNVAIATHGESVTEALGSGDGGQANQRFTLRRAPLTWVSAATPSGRTTTLEIRVDG